MSVFRNWKISLGLLALFVAGMIVGGVVTLGGVRRAIRQRMDSTTWAPRAMKWFHDEIHTTPEQESQLRPLVDSSVADMVKLRDASEEKFRNILASMVMESTLILTDSQIDDVRAAVRRAQADKSRLSFGGRP